jgi:hypothetical protein
MSPAPTRTAVPVAGFAVGRGVAGGLGAGFFVGAGVGLAVSRAVDVAPGVGRFVGLVVERSVLVASGVVDPEGDIEDALVAVAAATPLAVCCSLLIAVGVGGRFAAKPMAAPTRTPRRANPIHTAGRRSSSCIAISPLTGAPTRAESPRNHLAETQYALGYTGTSAGA